MREPGQIDALMAADVDRLHMTVGEEHPSVEASGRSDLVIDVSFQTFIGYRSTRDYLFPGGVLDRAVSGHDCVLGWPEMVSAMMTVAHVTTL